VHGSARQPVAMAVRVDGRRLAVPVAPQPLVALPAALRPILLGIEGLLVLLTRPRRENGGTR
jgi:hypothetical protein